MKTTTNLFLVLTIPLFLFANSGKALTTNGITMVFEEHSDIELFGNPSILEKNLIEPFNYSTYGDTIKADKKAENISDHELDSINQLVFLVAENMPEFKGGSKALAMYLKRNVAYPEIERTKRNEEKVLVMFTVKADGSITDVKAITGSNDILKQSAIKGVAEMPEWFPGTNNGNPVSVRCVMPINFVLK
mgnify:CR=1 FL=1